LPELCFKKALSFREHKPLPYTSKSEEVPGFTHLGLVSHLPFMKNLVQDVALQGNWKRNGHKCRQMFSLRTVTCVPEQSGKGQTYVKGMAQLSLKQRQRTSHS
jgi:phosphohistidine phosphatase SixA